MTKEERREKWLKEHPELIEKIQIKKPLFYYKKRKCSNCKEILDLNKNNFYPTRIKVHCFYSYVCKSCNGKRLRTNEKSIKEKLKDKLGKKCNKCGMISDIKGFFDLDHIIPIRRRVNKTQDSQYSIKSKELKRTDIKNIYQVLCPNCHRLKTINEKHLFSLGRRRTD